MGETVPENRNLNQLGQYAKVFEVAAGDKFETAGHTYELIDCIGEGGMAQVWRAKDETGTNAAIKFIRQLLASDEAYKLRLKKEAALAKEMNHPNVVHVYDFVENDNLCYIVMEYVRGGDLYEYMHEELGMKFAQDDYKHKSQCNPRKVLSVDNAIRIIRGITDVYVQAQLAGRRIVHRDLKPENILLDGDFNPKLSDFGIAKDLDSSTQLTKTGFTPGTFLYMAPERILEEGDISVQSDMYSLGVLAYYMLAGRPPFYSDDGTEMLDKHCKDIHTPLHEVNTSVPHILSRIVDCLLTKNPAARFDPAGLASALKRFESGREPEYPPLFVAGQIDHPVAKEEQATYTSHRYMAAVALLLGIIALLALGIAIFVIFQDRSNQSNPQPDATGPPVESTR